MLVLCVRLLVKKSQASKMGNQHEIWQIIEMSETLPPGHKGVLTDISKQKQKHNPSS